MATNKSGRRTRDFQTSLHTSNILPDIVLVDGNLEEAGFLAWISTLPMKSTHNQKFTHFEDAWRPSSDTVNGALSDVKATSIVVDTILAFNANELWFNKRTGEIYHIDSVSEGENMISVTRAVGRNSTDSTGTAAAAINDGDTLISMGSTMGEVSTRQNSMTTVPAEVYNLTEKKRWEITMSDWQRKTQMETGYDWDYQVDKTMKEARKALNRWLYLGERNIKAIGGQTKYMAGGIDYFISTNIHAASATLHEYEFDAWMTDTARRFGPKRKDMLCSMNVIKAVNQMTKDRTQIQLRHPDASGKQDIGIWVQNYTSPTGRTLRMSEDRFLTDDLNGHARVIDFDVVRLRHFDGDGLSGKIHLKENTQDVDADDFSDTIIGDIGPEFGPEKHHGKLSGVTQGASGRSVS